MPTLGIRPQARREPNTEASLNESIALAGPEQFARENASRMLYFYGRRRYGTRLTNRDLARIVQRRGACRLNS